MSAAADLAADLTALRRALGVSEEMSIEAIVCAVLIIRKEGSEAETLRMKNLREVNALKETLGTVKLQLDACQALLDDERKAHETTKMVLAAAESPPFTRRRLANRVAELEAETAKFQRLTEILHQMQDEGSATVVDVLEEVKRRVATDDEEATH